LLLAPFAMIDLTTGCWRCRNGLLFGRLFREVVLPQRVCVWHLREKNPTGLLLVSHLGDFLT
jgi:hypothetical protein